MKCPRQQMDWHAGGVHTGLPKKSPPSFIADAAAYACNAYPHVNVEELGQMAAASDGMPGPVRTSTG